MREIANIVNRVLDIFGVKIIRSRTIQEIKVREEPTLHPVSGLEKLPAGAQEYLRLDSPRLIELKERYRNHRDTRHSVWQDSYLGRDLTLSHFRGDNAYIWQTRNTGSDPLLQYSLTGYYVKDIDRLGLFNRLEEDGQFGAVTFRFNEDKIISRDLLDSILEINFLERQLQISKMTSPVFLDIGAGYGRLAYRLVSALPNIKTVFCTDGVAESTFLCEYYLKFRNVGDRAKAVPIDEIEEILSGNHIDIATNIESFTECTIESITWWLDLIQRYRVRYLMIIPDYRDALLSRESDGSKVDFRPLIEERGFDLIATEPIYGSATSVTAYGLYPNRAFLLFRNRAAANMDCTIV